MTDHDAEADAIVAELEAAGLVTVGTDADGRETWRLTEMGAQLARQVSMTSADDAAAMLDALLDAQGQRRPMRPAASVASMAP